MLLEVRTVVILGMPVTTREPCGGGQATRATFCFLKKNYFYFLIWLHWVLAAACGISSCDM